MGCKELDGSLLRRDDAKIGHGIGHRSERWVFAMSLAERSGNRGGNLWHSFLQLLSHH
jgi:hypothetical protein